MDKVALVVEPGRGLSKIAIVGALLMAVTLPPDLGHRPASPPRSSERRRTCYMPAPSSPVESLAREPAGSLTMIKLERRFLLGEPSPEAVNATLGSAAPAWESFMYLHDAQPRLAVASEIYASDSAPAFEFGRDEHGGIWMVELPTRAIQSRAPLTYTRDIYLLPAGSSFRGIR